MKKEKDVQAFVTETIDTAKEQAKNVNRENSKLAGIPIGLKR